MIGTMPIKPYKNIGAGLLVAPVLCDILADILKCNKVLSFNLLNSYEKKDYYLTNYIDVIDGFGIKGYEILRDIDNVENYLDSIERLIHMDAIKMKKRDILKCSCGKVQISSAAIRHNKQGDLYKEEHGKIICNFCKSECRKYFEDGLYLQIKKEFIRKPSIYPKFLKADFNNLLNVFIDKDILVSKDRDTNYFVKVNGKNFNIDIDMLWMMFNQHFDNDNQVLIASNHQLYEIFISNYVNGVFDDKRVSYIATPYLVNKDNKFDIGRRVIEEENSIRKKLMILYNLKWKYKTLNWNNGVLEIIKRMSESEIQQLYYNILNINFNTDEDLNVIIDCLFSELNLSKNVKSLTR